MTAVGGPASRRERSSRRCSYAILLALLLIVVFPFYWMTITSFKSEDQMRSLVSMFWPSPFARENYAQLLDKTEFLGWYGNSVVVAVSSTLLATAIGTIGAYALARLRFLGRAFMASAVLITYLVPPSILFIPLYAQIRNLGLADSLAGLIAAYPSFTVPFVTWLLMGYFESIPEELEEAAMIDGATRFGAFCRDRAAAGRAPASWPPRSTPSPRPGTSSCTRWSSSPTSSCARCRSGSPASSPATCTAGATSWRARCSPRCRSSPPTSTCRSTWSKGSPRAASRASLDPVLMPRRALLALS